VELYGINPRLELKEKYEYFDSDLEGNLLEVISSKLEGGGKIYVEYQEDRETAYGLQYDFPFPITRLGYKLFNLGFTWFKDWYFPEGGSEGTQKLQGEKPLDEDASKRHKETRIAEIKEFIKKMKKKEKGGSGDHNVYLRNALKRAEDILRK
jgi:hypothetical protein